MPLSALSAVVATAARSVTVPDTDGELLRRFVRSGEEPAFAALVRRLGPMVLGVCRRVSGDSHLAEDAFQAAFVVLARRASEVRPAEAVRAWLYGVAVRTARGVRAVSARRLARETPVPAVPDHAGELTDPPDADSLAILDEEVAGLPEHLRVAVVLCELDGLSRRDAAERLAIAEGTLSSRLAKARKLLADRLRKRGVSLPAVGLAVLATSAPVSARLAATTSALASAGAPLPPAVAALSNGVFRTMFAQKLKVAVPLAAVVFGALTFAALAAGPAPELPPVKPVPVAFAQPPAKADPKPLPKGPNRLLFPRAGHLVTIDPDGKNEKQLIDREKLYFSLAGGSFSPDGTRVCFVWSHSAPEGYTHYILVVKLDGKDTGTNHENGSQPRWACWSPDGTQILVTEAVDGAYKAGKYECTHHTIDITTGKRTKLDLPVDHLITDWGRDGSFLATQMTPDKTNKNKWDIHHRVLGSDGKPKTEIKFADKTHGPKLGKFSPDCRRILYCLDRQPEKESDFSGWSSALAVYDIASGKPFLVADVPLNAEIQSACWSPDGKKIAYSWHVEYDRKKEDAEEQEIEWHVTVCDPDGKNQQTIASEKGKVRSYQIGAVDWR